VIGETVTITRYGTDRYGDRVQLSTHTLTRCAFAPRARAAGFRTGEDTDRAQAVTSDAELYVPTGSDIAPTDTVILADGTTWEVTGRPERWTDPFSGQPVGVVVALNRMTG
jgi:hypothetical protein